MVVYLSFHTVYFSNNLYCFLKLLFPFLLAPMIHKWTCISWLQLWLFLLSIFETGITTVTSNTILSDTFWTDMSCVAELVLWARAMQTCLKTSEQQNVDWLLQDTVHELVNSRHLNLAWTDICTALGGGRKTWSAGCMNEDILWGGKLCLVNKLCFIYTACLYIVFFCLRVISLALVCNANASLLGNWHSKCYLIITQSNYHTRLKEITKSICLEYVWFPFTTGIY